MTGECIDALYGFFSAFGIPAWPEESVPLYDDTGAKTALPYITVQLIAPDWRADARPFYARVWYRDKSYDAICAKVDEIRAAIGEGVSIPTEHGAVYIAAADTFCQFQPYPGDTTLKCAYLSMTLSNHTI